MAEADIADQPFDGRWLHVDDAVQAVERAVAFTPSEEEPATGWWVYHIPAAGPRTRVPLGAADETRLGYAPQHDFRAWWPADWQHPPAAPELPAVLSRPIRKVVVFGAGGPLAAAAAPLLAETHTVRLTDPAPAGGHHRGQQATIAGGAAADPARPTARSAGRGHHRLRTKCWPRARAWTPSSTARSTARTPSRPSA